MEEEIQQEFKKFSESTLLAKPRMQVILQEKKLRILTKKNPWKENSGSDY